MRKHEKVALQMFKDQDFDEYEVPLLVEILEECDDLYTNDDVGSYLTDPQYDFLRQFTYAQSPTHAYFIGIGSEVRGEKVKLPHTMGSLDQVYVGDIPRWATKWDLLRDEKVVISDKLDGASAMVIYDTAGDFQIAYSRGDGIEGADISRHMRKMQNCPNEIPNDGQVFTIRGENIFELATFRYLKSNFFRKDGKPYKNPRNMVAGVMNAESKEDELYDFVKFVAYEIVGSELSKQEQFRILDVLGFETPYSLAVDGDKMTDDYLRGFLESRKAHSVYEIDGVVLDVDRAEKRAEMNPTRSTLNPAYTVKYKVTTEDNILEIPVVDVEYNPSSHGYLKPRVNLKPTEMGGVTVSWATGFNTKFIESNHIGPGAVLRVTRSGDVIPFIMGVVTAAPEPQMPPEEYVWHWSKNEVDAILDDPISHPVVAVKIITKFFDKIDAPMLKFGNVQKLYDSGFKTVESIIRAGEDQLVDILGKNGSKVYNGIHEKLKDIQLYKLIGAHSTVRGVGVRRMKKLQEALGRDELFMVTESRILPVEGFDEIMADASLTAIEDFKLFYYENEAFITLAEEEKRGTSLAGEKICLTGFRDKELSAFVEAEGGTVQSSVSGKTTMLVAKDPNSTTGKPKKARELGIPILGVDEFKQQIGF